MKTLLTLFSTFLSILLFAQSNNLQEQSSSSIKSSIERDHTESTDAPNPDTSIWEQDKEKRIFSVYPNPANDIIQISSKNEGDLIDIELLDINGKVIFKGNRYSGFESIGVSDLSEGIYFARVYKNGSVETHKFIVSR